MPDVGLIGDKWGGMKGKKMGVKGNRNEDRVENKRKEADEMIEGGGSWRCVQ